MKTIAFLYFLGFSLLNLMMDVINNKFSFFDVILVVIFTLAFFIKKKWFSQIIGSVFVLISLFVFFSVFLSHVKGMQTDHLNDTWTYLMGYLLSIITLFFSLILIGFLKINSIFVEGKM